MKPLRVLGVTEAGFEYAAERLTTRQLLVLGLRHGLFGDCGSRSFSEIAKWLECKHDPGNPLIDSSGDLGSTPAARLEVIERQAMAMLGYDSVHAWVEDFDDVGPIGTVIPHGSNVFNTGVSKRAGRWEWRASDAVDSAMVYGSLDRESLFTKAQWVGRLQWTLYWAPAEIGSEYDCLRCLEQRGTASKRTGRPRSYCSDVCRQRA